VKPSKGLNPPHDVTHTHARTHTHREQARPVSKGETLIGRYLNQSVESEQTPL
jgi:hypothetical protein